MPTHPISDPEILRSEKRLRMIRVYERDKQLRESADVVVFHGEVVPPNLNGTRVYIETATGAKLRRYFDANPPTE